MPTPRFPCRLPPLGAKRAFSRIVWSTSSGSGSSVNSRTAAVVRITSYRSMSRTLATPDFDVSPRRRPGTIGADAASYSLISDPLVRYGAFPHAHPRLTVHRPPGEPGHRPLRDAEQEAAQDLDGVRPGVGQDRVDGGLPGRRPVPEQGLGRSQQDAEE